MSAIGSATPAELVAFAHAALFSPAPSTLAIALKKGFVQYFPGLTEKTLAKYPPRSYAMVKGHMDQTRKNQNSTKTANEPSDLEDDFSPAVQDSEATSALPPSPKSPARSILTKLESSLSPQATATTIFRFI